MTTSTKSEDVEALADAQAREALRKAKEERCSNFDKGAVFHWAERGRYVMASDFRALMAERDALREALVKTTRALDEISDETNAEAEISWRAVKKTIHEARAALGTNQDEESK